MIEPPSNQNWGDILLKVILGGMTYSRIGALTENRLSIANVRQRYRSEQNLGLPGGPFCGQAMRRVLKRADFLVDTFGQKLVRVRQVF